MAPTFDLKSTAEAVGGRIVRGAPDTPVRDVATDSRGVLPEGALFVALRGPNFDGHQFLPQALEHGASIALVERADAASAKWPAVIVVDDTLRALQAFAAAWRAAFAGKVVGITGSNGKTIVKEMLAAILGRTMTVHRSPGSFNSQVGVALSVLGITAEHEVAIIEAGISATGEMQRLQPMITPDIGVVTNIGTAHAAGLHDLQTTAREKLALFADLEGPLVWHADDATLARIALPGRPISFGSGDEADYRIREIFSKADGFEFVLGFPEGTSHRFSVAGPGIHNVRNAAAAVVVAAELGLAPTAIAEGLRQFEVTPMRMELHTSEGGVTLLNDAYSSDPVSAAAALHALVHHAAGHRTIAILGDMLDLGAASQSAHEQLGELVARLEIDHLVCVGGHARGIGRAAAEHGMPLSRIWDADRDEPLDTLLGQLVLPGDYVLFKGSRAVGLERAAEGLLESVGPTRLYVDLDAIRQNFQAVRARTGHDTKIMAVVKSHGYGNDSTRIALTLVREGVDALAVAFPDEAIPLRQRGIDVPILVTNVRAPEVDKIVKYGLTPLISTVEVLGALDREATRRGATVDVHVEVDTGMNRLGLSPEDTLEFVERVRAAPSLSFAGIMTHFAAADDPAEDAFTREQIARFDAVLAELGAHGGRPTTVHAANTAAAWRFPEARYDMVRLGLGLYGVNPSEDVARESLGTRPALRFVTEVLAVKTVQAGDTVGYSRTWKADGVRRIATIAVGYNDGFPRFMSNGGEVLVRGKRCPVVGNVCMDVCMVDVTGVRGVRAGDEVVLFGEQRGVYLGPEELASRGGTINYEILTNVAPRVRRIFVSGNGS